MTTRELTIYTDGGARGNPGPAGAGAVILEHGQIIQRLKRYLGEATNNQAEYEGLIMTLEAAHDLGGTHLEVNMDSLLLVRQLQGRYKVRNAQLAKLFVRAHNLVMKFVSVKFIHVPREQNSEADRLVNEAIDKRL